MMDDAGPSVSRESPSSNDIRGLRCDAINYATKHEERGAPVRNGGQTYGCTGTTVVLADAKSCWPRVANALLADAPAEARIHHFAGAAKMAARIITDTI